MRFEQILPTNEYDNEPESTELDNKNEKDEPVLFKPHPKPVVLEGPMGTENKKNQERVDSIFKLVNDQESPIGRAWQGLAKDEDISKLKSDDDKWDIVISVVEETALNELNNEDDNEYSDSQKWKKATDLAVAMKNKIIERVQSM